MYRYIHICIYIYAYIYIYIEREIERDMCCCSSNAGTLLCLMGEHEHSLACSSSVALDTYTANLRTKILDLRGFDSSKMNII